MTMQDRVVGMGARSAVWGLRLAVLYLPRWLLALKFRALGWLVWALTGSREAQKPLLELAEIFSLGPPYTVTLDKMFRDMEPEFIVSAARCLSRRSPYGAP